MTQPESMSILGQMQGIKTCIQLFEDELVSLDIVRYAKQLDKSDPWNKWDPTIMLCVFHIGKMFETEGLNFLWCILLWVSFHNMNYLYKIIHKL